MIHGGRGRGEEWKGLSSLAVLLFFLYSCLADFIFKANKKDRCLFFAPRRGTDLLAKKMSAHLNSQGCHLALDSRGRRRGKGNEGNLGRINISSPRPSVLCSGLTGR